MSVIKSALQYPELITHLLGANNYCWINFRNGEKKLLAKPLSYLEGVLPGFIRAHKTVLVNPAYVTSLREPPRQKMAGELQLDSGATFPVSRRRWNQVAEALESRLSPTIGKAATEQHTLSDLPEAATLEETPGQSILLVTDDAPNALLIAQIMEKKWPLYSFHSTSQGTHLPDLLMQVPEEDYPALLLLDARTTTLERLQTLERLKQHPQLCRLPVILLVSPVDRFVTDGYRRQANSVISLQDGYTSFAQTIERICQFWLQTAVLPDADKKTTINNNISRKLKREL